MKSNMKERVISAIAETQDGHLKSKNNDDDFNEFILKRINHNLYSHCLSVDVENLVSDFKYMINQLNAALKPLEQFIKDHPPIEIPADTKYFPLSEDLLNELLD